MTILFDTGSSILWIPTTDCTSCTSTPDRYNYGTGGGAFTGIPEEIEYLDTTSVKGQYMDVELTLNGLTIPSFRLLAADTYL